MSDNWIVQNLERALETWNEKLAEIWQLITQSPETFKGGAIWSVVQNIYGALQAIGYALLVLFFVIGVVKTCGSFAEIKKPEHAIKLFIRFALAKGVITYGMELMLALLGIIQGIISSIMNAAGFGAPQATVLPPEILSEVNVRLWDVCYCATGILSEGSDEAFEKWLDILGGILHGYDYEGELTPEEKQAVFYVICSIQMICVTYFESCDEYKELARTNRQMLQFIVQNKDQINNIL